LSRLDLRLATILAEQSEVNAQAGRTFAIHVIGLGGKYIV